MNADINEEIYLEPPEGSNVQDGHVCKLNKTIYGLKQSGRAWNLELARQLSEMGYEQSYIDRTIFFNQKSGIWICVYVDDMLIVAREMSELDQFKKQFESKFKMTDHGAIKQFLNMHIDYDRDHGSMWISQTNQIENLAKEFLAKNDRPVKTPLETKGRNAASDLFGEVKKYQRLVGSLLYIANATRPDIAHAASYLGQFNNQPLTHDWEKL